MPASANNQRIDFLGLLPIGSLPLSTPSLVLLDFGFPQFPLCKQPTASSLLNLKTVLAMVFLCSGFNA